MYPDKVAAVSVFPNLTMLPSFEKNVCNKMILFVGGDFRRKGGITLFRAFEDIKRRVENTKLFIDGSSPKYQVVESQLRICEKRRVDLPLQAPSIFAIQSTFEPFGHFSWRQWHIKLHGSEARTKCLG